MEKDVQELETADVQPMSELIERLFSVGAHFGYARSRRHPSHTPYIFGTKNRVEIFDLEKTSPLFEAAKAYAEHLGREHKVLLFVSGKNEAKKIIVQAASSIEMPYVGGRWIGGTISNFNEIRKRIDRLEELRLKRDTGGLDHYTKKERLMITREIDRLETNFGGLVSLKTRPDAFFIIDTKRESIAATEAKNAGIPVIALLSSDCDLTGVTYPIPANDASQKSIQFFVDEITRAYQTGLRQK
jgi:small subunit ribosomal protein S2